MAKANFYDTAYLTTCIVPVDDANGVVVSTHHSHFSVGPRVENGIRDIIHDCHPVTCCGGPRMYQGRRARLDMIVALGFDISTVTDWTDEEAAVLSGLFCPTSEAQYDAEQRIAAAVEERVRLTQEAVQQLLLAEAAEEQRRLAEEQRRQAEQLMWEEAWTAAEEAAAQAEQSDGYESDEAL